mgnify:CR=1 FL=1
MAARIRPTQEWKRWRDSPDSLGSDAAPGGSRDDEAEGRAPRVAERWRMSGGLEAPHRGEPEGRVSNRPCDGAEQSPPLAVRRGVARLVVARHVWRRDADCEGAQPVLGTAREGLQGALPRPGHGEPQGGSAGARLPLRQRGSSRAAAEEGPSRRAFERSLVRWLDAAPRKRSTSRRASAGACSQLPIADGVEALGLAGSGTVKA